MPANPNKVLISLPPEAREALDRIARNRVEFGAEPNRSDAVRWLISEYLKREKKSRKKSEKIA